LGGGEIFEIKMCFDFLYKFVSDVSLSKRTERDMIKMYIGLHVKYPSFLSNFNETWISATDFRKILKHFMKIRLGGAELFRADRQTDMKKLMFVYRNFANATKISQHLTHWGRGHLNCLNARSRVFFNNFNTLNAELNPVCYLLALLAHLFLYVSRIRVKSLTLRLLMSYIYGAPILDVSRSHTTTQHSR